MARDKKLREVLDSLSGDPARSLPAQDRELMESVLRRLKIQENRRLAEREPEPEPTEQDMTQQELEQLRERQLQDSEEKNRLQEERERLLSHQRELEERLARLEAASHGGPLSYVDEPETVEFSRVDLNEAQEEELLEFNYLGQQKPGFDPTPQEAWEDEPAQGSEPDWEDWPDQERPSEATRPPAGEIAWDEEETAWPEQPEETAWDAPANEDAPAPQDVPPWSEDTGDEDPWPPQQDESPWDDTPEQSSSPPTEPSLEELDDRTRFELEDLERQLAELEKEIEKRGGHQDEEGEETA